MGIRDPQDAVGGRAWTAGMWRNVRKPVTLPVLRQLAEVFPQVSVSGAEAAIFKAAFLLGFLWDLLDQ